MQLSCSANKKKTRAQIWTRPNKNKLGHYRLKLLWVTRLWIGGHIPVIDCLSCLYFWGCPIFLFLNLSHPAAISWPAVKWQIVAACFCFFFIPSGPFCSANNSDFNSMVPSSKLEEKKNRKKASHLHKLPCHTRKCRLTLLWYYVGKHSSNSFVLCGWIKPIFWPSFLFPVPELSLPHHPRCDLCFSSCFSPLNISSSLALKKKNPLYLSSSSSSSSRRRENVNCDRFKVSNLIRGLKLWLPSTASGYCCTESKRVNLCVFVCFKKRRRRRKTLKMQKLFFGVKSVSGQKDSGVIDTVIGLPNTQEIDISWAWKQKMLSKYLIRVQTPDNKVFLWHNDFAVQEILKINL